MEVLKWGPGDEASVESRLPDAEAVCRHCLQNLTTETIKIENFAQLTSGLLTSMFHDGG